MRLGSPHPLGHGQSDRGSIHCELASLVSKTFQFFIEPFCVEKKFFLIQEVIANIFSNNGHGIERRA